MYNVHCTVHAYTVYCTLYIYINKLYRFNLDLFYKYHHDMITYYIYIFYVQYTTILYIVFCTLFAVHIYCIQCTLYSVQLNTVPSTMYKSTICYTIYYVRYRTYVLLSSTYSIRITYTDIPGFIHLEDNIKCKWI